MKLDQFGNVTGTLLSLYNQKLLEGASINSLAKEFNVNPEIIRMQIISLKKKGFIVRKGPTTIHQHSDDAIYKLEER